MAHQLLSYRTVIAGLAVALLTAGLMASAFSSGHPAAADEHDGGLTDAVDDVVDVSDEDEDAEAAESEEPEEVEPQGGGDGGGGQEPAEEEPPPQQPSDDGGEEPADEPTAQQSGSSAPVPSGPRRAAGPRVNPDGRMPASAGTTFDASLDGGGVAAAPEVFTEDGDGPPPVGIARRPNSIALASLPGDNGSATLGPSGPVPRELIAASIALLVIVGAGHALHATRRLNDDPLQNLEPSDAEA